ncbi:hypothetical protein ES707_11757 [subsurface metagenome]
MGQRRLHGGGGLRAGFGGGSCGLRAGMRGRGRRALCRIGGALGGSCLCLGRSALALRLETLRMGGAGGGRCRGGGRVAAVLADIGDVGLGLRRDGVLERGFRRALADGGDQPAIGLRLGRAGFAGAGRSLAERRRGVGIDLGACGLGALVAGRGGIGLGARDLRRGGGAGGKTCRGDRQRRDGGIAGRASSRVRIDRHDGGGNDNGGIGDGSLCRVDRRGGGRIGGGGGNVRAAGLAALGLVGCVRRFGLRRLGLVLGLPNLAAILGRIALRLALVVLRGRRRLGVVARLALRRLVRGRCVAGSPVGRGRGRLVPARRIVLRLRIVADRLGVAVDQRAEGVVGGAVLPALRPHRLLLRARDLHACHDI